MPAMATVDHDWLAMALSVASETSTGKSDLKGLRWQVLEVSRGRFGCAAEPTAGDPIPVLDEVLIAMQQFMNSITIPSPEDAKAWLKSRGGDASARSLGRLSSLRNAKAHSLGMRIVADASRLAEQVQTDDGWQQWHDDDGIDEEGLQQLNRESQVVPVKSLMRKHPVASSDDEPEDEDSAGSDRGAAPGSSGFVAQQAREAVEIQQAVEQVQEVPVPITQKEVSHVPKIITDETLRLSHQGGEDSDGEKSENDSDFGVSDRQLKAPPTEVDNMKPTKRRQLKVQLSDASTAASEHKLVHVPVTQVMEAIVHVPKILQQERMQDEALERQQHCQAMMRAWLRRNAG